MYSASSLTQPSSADPLVYCHGMPRKYRAGISGLAIALAAGRLVFEDTAYFFCTLACAAGFAHHPERFIG
jgi:hypothetical protein